MADDRWISFAAGEALMFVGDAREARERLLRALRLGEVQSRGVYLPDQEILDDGQPRKDFEPEDIPADRWATCAFLPIHQGPLSAKMRALQWLVPAGKVLSRVCQGYADVRLFRSDIEKIADVEKSAAAIKGRASRGPSLAAKLAAELTKLYPNGRPSKQVEEIRQDLERLPAVGTFEKRTLERAIKRAWPSN